MRTTLATFVLLAACSEAPRPDLLRAALVPVEGDPRIAQAQDAVRREPKSLPALERLGTALIAKARETHDSGWYKLAEQVALAIEPGHASGLLLRGHVLHSLHRFADAEVLAREAVAKRGLLHDHGLLGDVLYDQGRVPLALASYQKMLDLRPCLQSYARAAQIRWIRGDLAGSRELLARAAGAGSPRDPEPLAWTLARKAHVALQLGDLAAAAAEVEDALRHMPAHQGAWLVQARLCLARGEKAKALDAAARAAEAGGDVEARWLRADCLRMLGRETEARAAEAELERTGAADDPRTFALYLATRGKDPATAKALAEKELEARRDVFTHDALAFALFASGSPAARAELDQALAEGTKDARLYLHAALLVPEQSAAWAERARPLAATLLPSERALLDRFAAR